MFSICCLIVTPVKLKLNISVIMALDLQALPKSLSRFLRKFGTKNHVHCTL
jgi:hypothetical protein